VSTSPQVLTLALASDRRVIPETGQYRTFTEAEVRALRKGDYPFVLLNSGKVGQVRVTSDPRTWKRDPGRVEVSLSRGLYDSAIFSLPVAMGRLLKPIPESK
jgi:hypothetical protein